MIRSYVTHPVFNIDSEPHPAIPHVPRTELKPPHDGGVQIELARDWMCHGAGKTALFSGCYLCLPSARIFRNMGESHPQKENLG